VGGDTVRKRILILDDDDIRHDIWRESFAKAGHDVVCVHTIEAFQNVVENGSRFDLIFLDHDLNDHPTLYQSVTKGGYRQTGKTACHILRALPTPKHPDHVIIHSWNDEGAIDMWKLLTDDPGRAYSVIIKPFPVVLWRRHPKNNYSFAVDNVEGEEYDWFERTNYNVT
jgi:CheY-like chemotaxis protein